MNKNYLTTTTGTGGRIKQFCEDFIVEEIGKDYKTELTYLPDKKTPEFDWDLFFENKNDSEQLLLDMEKFNLSTTSAINQISRFLRVSKRRIGYAGLKDKRAITVQKISIYEPNKERLKKLLFKNIKIYNPVWSEKRIDIGDLNQNRFTITVRQIKHLTKEELNNIFNDFKNQVDRTGIINYFGEQRFGGMRDITHKVGKLIIKRKYKEAILLYLTETHEFEIPEITKAREELKNELNYGKHAKSFPSKTGYESAILNYLARNPDDFLGAFKVLPKAIQYLFVHAYQSYLFNEIISERLKEGYGVEKIEGDTIINNELVIPLFGFESKISEKKAGEIEKRVLDKEGITLEDFYNKDHSVFSSKGDYRALITPVYDIKLHKIEEDSKNEDSLALTFSFILNKGNYATNLAKELIKPDYPKWC